MLEFEFVTPRDQRAPDKLIGGNHDENDGADTGQQGVHVAS